MATSRLEKAVASHRTSKSPSAFPNPRAGVFPRFAPGRRPALRRGRFGEERAFDVRRASRALRKERGPWFSLARG
jgi:hypothetical protein